MCSSDLGGMVTDRFLESKEGMTEFLSLVIDQQVYYATMDPRLEVAMDKILKVAKDANASAARAKAEPNANASGAVVLDHSAPPKMAPATTLPVDGARVLRSLEDGAVAGSAI